LNTLIDGDMIIMTTEMIIRTLSITATVIVGLFAFLTFYYYKYMEIWKQMIAYAENNGIYDIKYIKGIENVLSMFKTFKLTGIFVAISLVINIFGIMFPNLILFLFSITISLFTIVLIFYLYIKRVNSDKVDIENYIKKCRKKEGNKENDRCPRFGKYGQMRDY
jgi:hypothetical protein